MLEKTCAGPALKSQQPGSQILERAPHCEYTAYTAKAQRMFLRGILGGRHHRFVDNCSKNKDL